MGKIRKILVILRALIALAVVFGLLAVMRQTALAAGFTINIGTNNSLLLGIDQSGTGWEWVAGNNTNNVLKLNPNYTGEPITIHCSDPGDVINIVYSGNVTVAGISCGGHLTIDGGGVLAVNGDAIVYGDGSSVGIEVFAGASVTISGSVYAPNAAYLPGVQANEAVSCSGGSIKIAGDVI